MSRRLTNYIKDRIKMNVLSKTFKERNAQLELLENDAALYAYNILVLQKEQALMAQLPDDFFAWSKKINFNYKHTDQKSSLFSLALVKTRPIPKSMDWNRSEIDDVYEGLTTKINLYLSTENKIKADHSALQASLTTLFAAVNTDKQFLEAWPEGLGYVS